ncbi:hypothetical protein FXO38_22551 [Capsicum annuum]|nr:hypothetical protein FXO38_22551 [Capsicum annuum]
MDCTHSTRVGDEFFYYSMSFDTIAYPTLELIKKELAGVIAIRRAVGQGQPNVEALYDQLAAMDSVATFGGITGGVVHVDGSHADADVAASHDDEHYVDAILCLMRGRQLVYPDAYDAGDKIMDLNFYNNFKDRYDELIDLASNPNGLRFDSLVSGFEWDEDMINYVRATIGIVPKLVEAE